MPDKTGSWLKAQPAGGLSLGSVLLIAKPCTTAPCWTRWRSLQKGAPHRDPWAMELHIRDRYSRAHHTVSGHITRRRWQRCASLFCAVHVRDPLLLPACGVCLPVRQQNAVPHEVRARHEFLWHVPLSGEGSDLLEPRGDRNSGKDGGNRREAGTDDHRWCGCQVFWVIIRVVVVAIGLNAIAASDLGTA